MKNIIQLYRTPGVNFSIEHVFEIVNKELSNHWNIYKVALPYAYTRPIAIFKNILYARRSCKRLVHIVGEVHYIAFFISAKTIITIHDLSFIDFNRGFKRLFYYWLWYYLPLSKATYITCISRTIAKQLENKFPFVKSKISVIYDPLDTVYVYEKKEFNKEFPVILHIGTAPNKNLDRVIEALKGIPCCLHVVGRRLEEYEYLLSKSGLNYLYRSNLSDEEVLMEYKQADIISFPSLYEGFGMPIIEGQAIGRVVLTSALNPMKEIGGDAALFVDPYSVNEIRQGFLTLINDDGLRNRLIVKGIHNVERFRADKIANQYSMLYQKIEDL